MTTLRTGFGEDALLIPSAWDAFIYRGFCYVRDTDGRFVIRGRVERLGRLTAAKRCRTEPTNSVQVSLARM